MFIQVISTVENSDISIQEIIDSWKPDTDPDTNLKLFMITFGAKLKWQEKKKTDIPQLLKDDLKKYGKYVKDKKIVENEDFASTYLQMIIDCNPSLPEGIDNVYKQYVDSYKLAGNPDDIIPGPIILTPDGKIDSIKSFPEFMKIRNSDKIFTYNQHFNEWQWLNFDNYKKQFKMFKTLYKNKKIVVQEENNNQHELNSHIWYSLVIQPINDEDEVEANICLGSVQMFKYMVSGFVYYFKNKTDRDNAYNYLKN